MERPHPHGDGRGFPPRGEGDNRHTGSWRMGWLDKIMDAVNKPIGPKIQTHHKELSPSQDDDHTRSPDKSGSQILGFSPAHKSMGSPSFTRPEENSETENLVSSPAQKSVRMRVQDIFGPPMSRNDELMLKKQLESCLQEVQFAIKAMDLEPVHIFDLVTVRDGKSRNDVVAAPARARGFGPSQRRGPAYIIPKRKSRSELQVLKTNKEALAKEQEHRKLIRIVEKYSKQIKDKISLQMSNKGITEESAHELFLLVDCMEKNLIKTIQYGGGLFSLAGLIRMMPLETNEFLRDALGFSNFAICVATLADRIIRSIGTSPVHFKQFGKETNSLLQDDFTFEKLKLNSDFCNDLTVAIGGQRGNGQAVKQLMLKLTEEKHTLSLNLTSTYDPVANPDAPCVILHQDDIALAAKWSVNQPFEQILKSVLQLAYPSYVGKFEIRGMKPYVAYAGCLEMQPNPTDALLNPHPVLDISGVFGMKYVGVGGQIGYNFGLRQFNAELGMSVRTKLSACGLKYKFRPGVVSATFLKKLVDTGTTLAADACYSPLNGQNHFTVGFKRAVRPTLYYKAKVGTAGASILVKKSGIVKDGNKVTGSWSVKGAVDVAFNDPWRLPKLGVVFSYTS